LGRIKGFELWRTEPLVQSVDVLVDLRPALVVRVIFCHLCQTGLIGDRAVLQGVSIVIPEAIGGGQPIERWLVL